METFTFPAQPTASAAGSSVSVAYSDILEHPEKYYQGFDLVWIVVSSAAIFLMIPALSFIYAGLGNRSFSLTLFRLPMVTAAFVGMQWVLWGYALTFSSGTLWWGGELRATALRDVLARPVAVGDGEGPGGTPIPELVYMLYEAMFASFTAALVCGGTMHRVRPARFIIFITLWSFLIYFPIARWSWTSYGWSKQLGTLDFAGGTPVHIVSGTTVAAFAIFCSIEAKKNFGVFLSDARRRFRDIFDNKGLRLFLNILVRIFTLGNYPRPSRPPSESAEESGEERPAEDGEERMSRTPTNTEASVDDANDAVLRPTYEPQPSNVNYVVFGTALLWFGWAGFNGGSALGGNMRAVSAWTSTHIAACAGGVTGMLWIWFLKAVSSQPSPSPAEAAGGEVEPAPPAPPVRETQENHKESIDRLSVFFFCDGAIAGLVAITPAAGYVSAKSRSVCKYQMTNQPCIQVPAWSAAVFGLVSALVVLIPLKGLASVFLRNDPLLVFPVHAGGGLVGMALTAFFVEYVQVP